MNWFTKKRTPYQDLAITAINSAMEIDIKNAAPFVDRPVNNLEAVIAIFWMVEKSFAGLGAEKQQQAGSHVMDKLLEWLSADYSLHEMRSLVIPAFERRLDEYEAAFTVQQNEAPTTAFMRTFKLMVEQIFNESEAHFAQITALQLLLWRPISDEGTRITALDADSKVQWH